MLAELLAATLLPHVLRQQLGVPAHHRAHLAEGGQRRHVVAVEGGGQVAEEPRPAQAAAADDHACSTGLLDHAQRVGGLPDVAVAEDGNVHVVDQARDGVPVGLAGVGLLDGAAVQGDGCDAGLLRDAARVEVGQVVVVEALAGLHRHRDVVRRCGGDGGAEDLPEQAPLPRQRSPAALAGHLGHRAAEVEVDVGHAVVGAEDLDGLADVDRVGAVELDRAHRLELVEDEHLLRGLVTLDQSAAGDHLADVEAGTLLGAEASVGRVGDAGHRGQHDRGLDAQRPQRQGGGHGAHAPIVEPVTARPQISRGAPADQQPTNFSANQRVMPSRLTRSWAIVSRSRIVTALSSRVSKSTVTQ